jgi:hypothetical protein
MLSVTGHIKLIDFGLAIDMRNGATSTNGGVSVVDGPRDDEGGVAFVWGGYVELYGLCVGIGESEATERRKCEEGDASCGDEGIGGYSFGSFVVV